MSDAPLMKIISTSRPSKSHLDVKNFEVNEGFEEEADRMTDQNDDNSADELEEEQLPAEDDSLKAQQLELEKRINEGYTKRSYINEETGLSLQELTCNYCQIKYGKLSNMKDHIRTHLAVKMFKC